MDTWGLFSFLFIFWWMPRGDWWNIKFGLVYITGDGRRRQSSSADTLQRLHNSKPEWTRCRPCVNGGFNRDVIGAAYWEQHYIVLIILGLYITKSTWSTKFCTIIKLVDRKVFYTVYHAPAVGDNMDISHQNVCNATFLCSLHSCFQPFRVFRFFGFHT